MIARLTGQLVERAGSRGVLDVRGVGYEVHAPARALEAWQAEEQAVVHISTQVREDSITLYGFATTVEREAFGVLLSVKGIGPRIALNALDTLSPTSLAQAVASSDTRTLSRVSGIGKKTAQRMCLELKDKLPASIELPASAARAPVARPSRPSDPLAAALAQLGYKPAEIEAARAYLEAEGPGPDRSISDRLAAALRYLYAR